MAILLHTSLIAEPSVHVTIVRIPCIELYIKTTCKNSADQTSADKKLTAKFKTELIIFITYDTTCSMWTTQAGWGKSNRN